ncbi:MAG: DUF4330 domain-containing protein [Candidatus Gastranaerophilales bacterium]|nr:DUF4330 domain-containing protein [Candidatus Gastranaerophilales bacterium]
MFNFKKKAPKFNKLDILIAVIVLLFVAGVVSVKLGVFKTSSNIITGEKPVMFTVVTRTYDVTSTEPIISKGDKSFITIRNVPYTELEVVDVKRESIKEMFFNYDRPEVPYLYDNLAYPAKYYYTVVLKDNATITKDGAVIGGNKIKIGLPVDIEGSNYRFSGNVSDVKVIEEEK